MSVGELPESDRTADYVRGYDAGTTAGLEIGHREGYIRGYAECQANARLEADRLLRELERLPAGEAAWPLPARGSGITPAEEYKLGGDRAAARDTISEGPGQTQEPSAAERLLAGAHRFRESSNRAVISEGPGQMPGVIPNYMPHTNPETD